MGAAAILWTVLAIFTVGFVTGYLARRAQHGKPTRIDRRALQFWIDHFEHGGR